MKFWLKIEAILNKILISITEAMASIIEKMTPGKIKKSISTTKNKSEQLKKNTQKTIAQKVTKTKSWGITKVAKSKEAVQATKAKAQKTVISAKSYDWKSLNVKKVIAILSALVLPFLSKLKAWLASLNPMTLITAAMGSVVLSLFSITIYKQTSEIQDKTKGEVREPASVSDTMDRNAYARSKYRHYKNRVLTLSSVNIPIYIEQRKGMQSLVIDFTLEADNRYIAKYFKIMENEYLLRDRLSRNVQPIVPNFPMEPEGKLILKHKIKDELNQLVKDLKIDGSIKNIYIHSILTD